MCVTGLVLVGALYRSPEAVTTSHGLTRSSPVPVRVSATQRGPARPCCWADLGVFNLGLIAYFSFVPGLLVESGYNLADGAFVTSLVLWLLMISMPVGGLWLQRTSRADGTLIAFSALTGLVMAVLSLAPSAALVLSCAMGLLLGPPPGAIMAMPGRVLRPETRAVGFGLFMTIYNITTAGGPVLAGC